jgi:hypothetical protein
MSSSFGMPGVNSAGPKHKTLLVVANFFDDVGFGRQMHCTNRLLIDRREQVPSNVAAATLRLLLGKNHLRAKLPNSA